MPTVAPVKVWGGVSICGPCPGVSAPAKGGVTGFLLPRLGSGGDPVLWGAGYLRGLLHFVVPAMYIPTVVGGACK